MGNGILKKRAKKAESKAGQGIGLVVEKFLGLDGFEPERVGTKNCNCFCYGSLFKMLCILVVKNYCYETTKTQSSPSVGDAGTELFIFLC